MICCFCHIFYCLQVPFDYSLRAYLEIIFLVPRMKISVQRTLVITFMCSNLFVWGAAFQVYYLIVLLFVFSQVKSRPLSKFLTQTVIETGDILRRPVELILGFSQLEWERANCGMFLYWHGRLIEVKSWLVCYR